MKESNIQQQIRLAMSAAGSVLFRNNVGQCTTDDGRVIRYGVCNPGGSDLIGWTPMVVTEDMVGRTVAVFTSIEVKRPGGRVSEAQQRFLDAVARAGGIGGVARSADEAISLLK
jgi:hypothetical protein